MDRTAHLSARLPARLAARLPARFPALLITLACLASTAQAHPLDEVFDKAQKSKATSDTKILGGVAADLDKSTSEARDKAVAGDNRRAERNRAYESAEKDRVAEQRTAANWTVLSEAPGGGLAHWYKKVVRIRCNEGRKSGETFSIHWLNSGRWQATSGSATDSLAASAGAECGR